MIPADTLRFKYIRVLSIATAASVLMLSGCEQRLKTGYGRAYGSDYSASVNGTVVFQEMVKATGRDVDRYGRVSPRWRKYQTVYWLPDGFAAPSEEAIDKIEDWLEDGWGRTLVFVGRDFDAAMLYWELLLADASENDADRRLNRELANATTSHLYSKNSTTELLDCGWYETDEFAHQPARRVSGVLSEGIIESELDLRYNSLPLPGDVKTTGTFKDYEVEVLLNVDSVPFVYSLRKNRWPESRIIVVGNGAFLLNMPLGNPEHRKLAENLLQYVHDSDFEFSKVLFIESDDQIAVSEHDVDQPHSKWSWITRRPLRFIVPNILFWCLLFCFVYFPIFGRPRKIKSRSTANFRDHIHALANLMHKTGSRKDPERWVDDYRRNARHRKKTSE